MHDWPEVVVFEHGKHFFYKNIVYKNVEPQIRDTIKSILTAQNV